MAFNSGDPMAFEVISPFQPAGDQPAAIAGIVERLARGERHVVLHGATGTGKSATTAWVIEKVNRPTLVLAPNKILAAQLAAELRDLLPNNSVCFFVSHFAYYRPEAYMPSTDTYVEKDSAIDAEIERLRHEATAALLSRPDVVVVASVSAIYGLGRPEEYRRRVRILAVGMEQDRDTLIRELVDMGYSRNDAALERGKIRVRGDIVDIWPSDQESVVRLGFDIDTVESMSVIDPLTGSVLGQPLAVSVFPTSHHVVDPDDMARAINDIKVELAARLTTFNIQGKLLEAQRLGDRVAADLEALEFIGFCKGVENYSRHFDGRAAGEPPSTLLDYLPDGYLTVVDESHVTVPQISAMYEGDQSRKRTLVDHGFRLPSALDNRPLTGTEFWSKVGATLYLSATPADWERNHAESGFVEQLIRPTGLVDPEVIVLPSEARLEDLLGRIRTCIERNERTLVTTITKKQAEQLADWLLEQEIRVRYLHHEISTVERIDILRQLRLGAVDVVVGVNLLREGLDLPEVSLVAVLDADTQGFLRSATSLIQTIGRAARNPNGQVVLYADVVTPAIATAVAETQRRRQIQVAHNLAHGITPTALSKQIRDVLSVPEAPTEPMTPADLAAFLTVEIERIQASMRAAAGALRFEEAAAWRDELSEARRQLLELAEL